MTSLISGNSDKQENPIVLEQQKNHQRFFARFIFDFSHFSLT